MCNGKCENGKTYRFFDAVIQSLPSYTYCFDISYSVNSGVVDWIYNLHVIKISRIYFLLSLEMSKTILVFRKDDATLAF